MFIKRPCKTCLIQACCTEECNELYKWYHKYRFFIEINTLIILVFGLISMILLTILEWTRIGNKNTVNSCADKIGKLVDENIKRGGFTQW